MRQISSLLTLVFLAGFSFAQNGLDFDGSNDYVGSNYPGISGNGERTIEAWIKTTVTASGSQQVIVDMGTMTVGTRFTFCLLQNNSIRCEIGGSGIVGTTAVNDGNWHHVAVTFDAAATNSLKLYIDGNLETQGNFSISVNTAVSGTVEVGRRNDGVNHFTGTIDEVRVWDIARTEAEIQASMNGEICNIDPNLRVYYRLNEGVAGAVNLGVNQATDDSGNGYTGTLNNFAYSGATSNWVTGVTLSSGLTNTTISQDACGTYTWAQNGQTYTSSGMYSETLTSSTGCDSTVILDLSIFNPNDLTTNQTACDSYTWAVNGQTYTATTTEVESLTTSQGCPYQHTLNVTINNGFESTEDVDACGSYVWPVNGSTYTMSGLYTEVMTATNGCDSTLLLNLNIIPVLTADITDNQDGTLSTMSAQDLQWYDCDNGVNLVGESSSTFAPTVNGTYAVIVSDFGVACPDTSDCISIDYLDLESLGPINSGITIEPNPTNGVVMISIAPIHGMVVVEIIDAQGKLIEEKVVNSGAPAEFTLEGKPGVYFVKALTEYGWITERLVKL